MLLLHEHVAIVWQAVVKLVVEIDLAAIQLEFQGLVWEFVQPMGLVQLVLVAVLVVVVVVPIVVAVVVED